MSVRLRFWLYFAVLGLGVVALVVMVSRASAQEYVTPENVHGWIAAYSAEYAWANYPYAQLVVDAERVARCESARFDLAVINGARLGNRGEVGVFQFLPGPRSIFWSTPSAAAGWDMWDPEANVAGAVYLISRGYGPRHWSCF